ncbi:MAG: hypothetical protein KDC12_15480, partial [Flavobacteriales bacterium]|nr:hypothetical protein [Flavobacteriales bacterium]
MLNQEQRIRAFVQLGHLMQLWGNRQEWPGFECGLTREEYNAVPEIFPIARQFNPWFTPDNVEKAMRSLGESMSESELIKWVGEYTFGSRSVTV